MTPQQWASEVLAGGIRAGARLMRGLDDGDPAAVEALKLLHPKVGRARIVGLTGSPGVGKSSLTNALIGCLRGRGLTVGVVAIDPTSPFSGGAILGDRVRMQNHATDEGVFIRSLATRGHFGGLTASTQAVVKVLDAMGYDWVLVETVGVGQDEVEIVRLADTTVVITVPGLGDDIQAIKAGILEVGDLFVVNKADRDGAERTMAELRAMLELDGGHERRAGWRPPVLPTCAVDGAGIAELVEAMDQHWDHLGAAGGALRRRQQAERARMELMDLLVTGLTQRVLARVEGHGGLEKVIEDITGGRTDPHTACQQILEGWLDPTGQGGGHDL